MDKENSSISDYDKPVAYDSEGHPLYAHPVAIEQPSSTNARPQIVQMIRSGESEKPIISDAVKLKHLQSKKDFPECNLSEGEYVIRSVARHPIGLFLPFALGVFLIALAFTLLFNFDLVIKTLNVSGVTLNASEVVLPILVFAGLISLGIFISYNVYSNNKLILTNESVIQEIQMGIFSKRERMVSLEDIEDVSYTQDGIIQQIFNYGDVRLSTEGEGTVYHFKFASNPKEVIAEFNNVVESFKNGRAIE